MGSRRIVRGSSTGPETDYIGDFLADRIEFDDAEGHPLRWLLLGACFGPDHER